MKTEFYLHFPEGLPRATAQQKGEAIRYKKIEGKVLPYIDHYRKPKVQALRNELTLKMKRYRPEQTSESLNTSQRRERYSSGWRNWKMDKPKTEQTRFLVDKRHGTYYCYEPNGRSHIEKSHENSPKGGQVRCCSSKV